MICICLLSDERSPTALCSNKTHIPDITELSSFMLNKKCYFSHAYRYIIVNINKSGVLVSKMCAKKKILAWRNRVEIRI